MGMAVKCGRRSWESLLGALPQGPSCAILWVDLARTKEAHLESQQSLRSPHFIDIKLQVRCQDFGLGTSGFRSCVFIIKSPKPTSNPCAHLHGSCQAGLHSLSLRIMHNLPFSFLFLPPHGLFSTDNQKGFYFIPFVRLYQERARNMNKIYCKKKF